MIIAGSIIIAICLFTITVSSFNGGLLGESASGLMLFIGVGIVLIILGIVKKRRKK